MRNRPPVPSGLELAAGVWRRRKWIAAAVFAAAFTAAASIVTFLPDVYRSTATVLVERHQVPEAFVKSSITGELETRLQTISQEILSRGRLEELTTRFDLYPSLRQGSSMEAVVEKMRRDIRLELKGVEQTSGRGATVAFALSFRGRDPETVARVTNTLALFYVDENSKIRERQAASTAQFLKAQLDETKKRLDEQERQLREFRMRHVGELPQQMGVNLATLERLNAQLHLASANQLRAKDRRGTLLKELAEADPGAEAGVPDAASAKVARLKQELLDLRRQFSDKYPDVIRVKAEIAALERELAAAKPDAQPAPTASADPAVVRLRAALRDTDAEIRAVKAEEQRLRQDIAAYQRRVENAPQREQEYQEESRDYGMTKDLYSSLLKRYEDAQLAESMEQSQRGEQFRILDPALPAKQPAAPNRLRLILMGLMVSLGTAAASVLLVERLDTSFHTMDSLRAIITAPVLVSIPLLVTKADRSRRTRRFCLAAASALLALALIVQASAYIARGNEQLVGMLGRGGP